MIGNYLNKSTAALLFIGLIGLFFCIQGFYFLPHDFSNYYFGAYFYSQGNFDTWIYFPHAFNQAIADLGYSHIFVSYAPNTPFLAQFFLLFSWMNLSNAKLVFNLLSLILLLYSLRKLMAITAVNPLYFALIPLIFFIPLQNNFLFGQVYLLLFFLLVEGWMAYRNDSFWKMGIFWTLAIGLKLSPIFIVGWLVVQKKWKPLFYLAGIGFLLLSLSILFSGWEVWEFYLTHVLPKAGAGEITTEYVQNYQSFHMLLKGLLVDSPHLFVLLSFGYKLMLILLAIRASREEKNELKLIGICLLTGILISPYGSTYGLLFLIFAAVFLLSKLGKNKKKNGLALILLFLSCNLPIQYVTSWVIPLSFPRLLLLLTLFILLVYQSIDRLTLVKSLGVIAVIITFKLLMFPLNKPLSDPLLMDHQPILIYDYAEQDGKLVYSYWTDKGAQKQVTSIGVKTLKPFAFSPKDSAAFGITNLFKPAILNDSILIYLSDEKRGIGFYALHSRQVVTDD